ncbi:hypothetical protein ACOMHN_021043 [Nucella lapillus]
MAEKRVAARAGRNRGHVPTTTLCFRVLVAHAPQLQLQENRKRNFGTAVLASGVRGSSQGLVLTWVCVCVIPASRAMQASCGLDPRMS